MLHKDSLPEEMLKIIEMVKKGDRFITGSPVEDYFSAHPELLNTPDPEGKTILHHLAEHNKEDPQGIKSNDFDMIAAVLIKNGANPFQKNDKDGKTPLDLAVQNSATPVEDVQSGRVKFIEYIKGELKDYVSEAQAKTAMDDKEKAFLNFYSQCKEALLKWKPDQPVTVKITVPPVALSNAARPVPVVQESIEWPQPANVNKLSPDDALKKLNDFERASILEGYDGRLFPVYDRKRGDKCESTRRTFEVAARCCGDSRE